MTTRRSMKPAWRKAKRVGWMRRRTWERYTSVGLCTCPSVVSKPVRTCRVGCGYSACTACHRPVGLNLFYTSCDRCRRYSSYPPGMRPRPTVAPLTRKKT